MNEGDFVVVPLWQKPHLVPVLAGWFAKEFAHEGAIYAEEEAWLKETLHVAGFIPTTFVILSGEIAVGTTRVFHGYMPDRPDYDPWLGYGITLPEYRGTGIWKKLFDGVTEECRRQGLVKLHAYLGAESKWWIEQKRREGWEEVERRAWDGHEDGYVLSYML